MARRKSAEELALEAEAASAASRPQDRADRHEDVVLPGFEGGRKKKAGGTPRLPKRLSFLFTLKGKVLSGVALIAVAAVVVGVVFLVRWNSTDVWDGTQDTSWYDAANPKSEYTITTAEQLAGIGRLVEDGTFLEGVTIKLGCNLDMYNISMKPIGSGRTIEGRNYDFAGNFDGQGHAVTGLNVEEDTWDDAGLFGSASGEYIKGLTVEGKVTGQVVVGGIVGYANGVDVTDCTNRCQVSALKTATSFYQVSAEVGGIVGQWIPASASDEKAAFTLSNLTNEGKVSARAANAGGVVGLIANTNGCNLTVSKLANKGDVELFCSTEERDEGAGGVIGAVNVYGDANEYSDLSNEGAVTCSSVLSAGGIFGAFMPEQGSYSVKNCVNSGQVSSSASAKRAHVGGVFGYIDDPADEFEGCSNSGVLSIIKGTTDDICATDGKEVWDAWEIKHPKTY